MPFDTTQYLKDYANANPHELSDLLVYGTQEEAVAAVLDKTIPAGRLRDSAIRLLPMTALAVGIFERMEASE